VHTPDSHTHGPLRQADRKLFHSSFTTSIVLNKNWCAKSKVKYGQAVAGKNKIIQ
jgi:hypothetical protein